MKHLFAVVVCLVAGALPAMGNTVCVGEVCREVETGALPSPARDTSQMPKKAGRIAVADWRYWAVTAPSIALSVVRTVTVARCRRDHGIGPCAQGGYGEFKAREGLEQGLTGGLAVAAWFHKKAEQDSDAKVKLWWIFQAANAGINARVIEDNATRKFKPKETE